VLREKPPVRTLLRVNQRKAHASGVFSVTADKNLIFKKIY